MKFIPANNPEIYFIRIIVVISILAVLLVPSGPPRNVLVEVLSSTEVRVTWDKVMDFHRNGEITFYEVMLQPFTTFNNQIPISMSMNVSEEDLNATVSGLEEFVEYNVTVIAGTIAGPGPYSQEVNITTEPDCKCAHTSHLLYS